MKVFKIAICTMMLGCVGIAVASDDVEKFFGQYVSLGDNFDSSVANLYADFAKIHAYRKYPHGLERNLEMTGSQWKALLLRVMPLAKAKNDKSEFSNIAISKIKEGYKIKADRYSVSKCYTDTGYYMVVQPRAVGGLEIVEEYMETEPLSNC